jgi:hypothetical protein
MLVHEKLEADVTGLEVMDFSHGEFLVHKKLEMDCLVVREEGFDNRERLFPVIHNAKKGGIPCRITDHDRSQPTKKPLHLLETKNSKRIFGGYGMT